MWYLRQLKLKTAVSMMGDRGFISYKDVLKLNFVIYPILDKLEYLASCDLMQAREAGEEMIRILLDLETDDDDFPNYDVQLIRDIITGSDLPF